MVDAAQNVFNWNWDLASFVATFGIIQDGDILTETLSLGCRGGLPAPNTGLNTHSELDSSRQRPIVTDSLSLDKFEADGSMARTDYNLSPDGDAYDVNGTLFGQLINTCQSSEYSHDCMGRFNQLRYNQSLSTNGYAPHPAPAQKTKDPLSNLEPRTETSSTGHFSSSC